MCSVVGYKKLKKDTSISSDFIKNSFDLMKSRGPDNKAYKIVDKLCALGHQRLSIIDVDDEATKAQIKRAFVKSLKTKKLNKKVLGEFIELVAWTFL